MSRVGGWLAAPVRAYRRWVSPALPPTCRYTPTCSEYAVTALITRGAVVGVALTGWRLLRCAPWGRGGWDPVPPPGRWSHPDRPAPRRTLTWVRRTPGTSSGTPRSSRREPSVVS